MKTRSLGKTQLTATLDKIKTEIRKQTRSVVIDNNIKELEKILMQDKETKEYSSVSAERDDLRKIVSVLSSQLESVKTLEIQKTETILKLRQTMQKSDQEKQKQLSECEKQLKDARNFCAQRDKDRTTYKIKLTTNLLLLKTIVLPRFINPECMANFNACYDRFCQSFI